MDKILIKNLLIRGIVGINPSERTNKQDILINMVMYADTKPAALSDDINDAVNYRTITKETIAYIEQSSHFLVEQLADQLAQLVLKNEQVKKVMVRVEKPMALRFAESVGIEIERTAADYA